MRNIPAIVSALSGWMVVLVAAQTTAAVFGSPEETRERIDRVERLTMERLFRESDEAQRLFEQAVGYAVFDVTKVSIGITGGGGTGVAVDKRSGRRTYMHMGTGGLNLGLGGQLYQVVFLFADEHTLQRFIDVGWEANASANAVAGRAGANAGANFNNGVALYQLTDAGLMLQADISGTKYWKSRRLNPGQPSADSSVETARGS